MCWPPPDLISPASNGYRVLSCLGIGDFLHAIYVHMSRGLFRLSPGRPCLSLVGWSGIMALAAVGYKDFCWRARYTVFTISMELKAVTLIITHAETVTRDGST